MIKLIIRSKNEVIASVDTELMMPLAKGNMINITWGDKVRSNLIGSVEECEVKLDLTSGEGQILLDVFVLRLTSIYAVPSDYPNVTAYTSGGVVA